MHLRRAQLPRTPSTFSRRPPCLEPLEGRLLLTIAVTPVTPDASGGQTLVNTLVSSQAGITVDPTTVSYTGGPNASGTFTGAEFLPFSSGIVLTTGDARTDQGSAGSFIIPGPNKASGTGSPNGAPGDNNLQAIVDGTATHDAAVLTFNFIPTTDQIRFQFVFASDEYDEYVGSSFNDVFAFFLNGNDITHDIARIPGTGDLISVNNVHDAVNNQPAQNAAFFTDNTDGHLNTELDGFVGIATPLFAQGTVIPGQVNTIKLAIADVSDSLVDSAVFFGAQSFTTVPPTVDPSYGTAGKTQLDFLSEHTAAQPDDKLVLAGHQGSVAANNSQAVLARLNADGTPDATFGTAGKVVTPLDQNVAGYGVAVQSDGKIVLSGEQANDFYLTRYNPDGSLDTTFGTAGIVKTDFASGSSDRAFSVAVQRNGKILAVGQSNGDFAVARYNADGSPDTTFGTGGLVTIDAGSTADAAGNVAVTASGTIAVAGVTAPDANGLGKYALVLLDANGAKIPTFDAAQNGVWTNAAANSDRTAGVAFDPNGNLIAGGSSTAGDFLVWKLTPTGAFDTTFGNGTFVTTDLGGTDDVDTVAAEPGGEIVAVGTSHTAAPADFTAAAAYTASGALDTTFGTGGAGKLAIPENVSRAILQPTFLVATASTLAPDGRVLVATQLMSNPTSGTPPITLVRRLRVNDVTPPTATLSFGPTLTDAVNTYSFQVAYTDDQAVLRSSLDSNDVIVTGPNGFSQVATLTGVDFNGDGTPRTATYQITSPGATFNSTDNGTYTVALQQNQVTDVTGNAATAASVGTFDVAVTFSPPMQIGTFGKVGKKTTKFSAMDQNGVLITFSLSGIGTGSVKQYTDGRLDVVVDNALGASLKISTARGTGTLNNIQINGAANSISAKTINLTGTLSAAAVKSLQLAAVTNGTVAAPVLTSFTATTLTNAHILAGVNVGPDGQLGGGDDSAVAAFVKSIKVTGPVTASVIAAGLNPANGQLLDGDDALIPGSSIKSISIGVAPDDTTRFVATSFPKKVKLGRTSVSPTTDPHFISTLT